MASKIQSHTFYVAITPYKAGALNDEFNELSVMTAYDDRRKHFYVSLHAGWRTGFGHGCIFLGPDDPLTAPKYVKFKDAPRNSQATINEAGASLELAKDAIAWLFNKRDWTRLYAAVRNIALHGYTEQFRKQMDDLMQAGKTKAEEPKGEPVMKQVDVMGLMNALNTTGKAKLSDFATPVDEGPETEVSEALKTWNDLKKKHPNALLLFRCGDFYEAYQEDAEAVAGLCGLTLTRGKGLGSTDFYSMVGFPSHALDTSLPRLIRAGHRVAICDQIGSIANSTNEQNKEDEEMKLNLNANKTNETVNVQPAAPVANPQTPAIEDADAVEVTEVEDITPAKPVAKPKTEAVTVPLGDHGTLVVGKPGLTPKPKRDKTGKFAKKSEAKVEPKPDPEAVGELAGMLTRVELVVYKTKKGADAPMITGFSGEDDPRWKKHRDDRPKWVSAGYRNCDDGSKRYHLMFGSRYMEVARQLSEAYNTTDREAWAKAEKSCADCYDGIVGGFKAEREAKRAERAAAKASEEKPAAEKTYTNKDVAEMLRKVLSGGDVPEDIKAMLKKAE